MKTLLYGTLLAGLGLSDWYTITRDKTMPTFIVGSAVLCYLILLGMFFSRIDE